jgi:glycosyltransferase involved in cell wall biosynthesis
MKPPRVYALAPSPVIYQVPLYRELAKRGHIELTVAYGSNEGVRPYSAGFGPDRAIVWDEDLLSGYDSLFLPHADEAHVERGFRGLPLGGAAELIRRCRAEKAALWIHGYSYALNAAAISLAKAMRVPLMLREEQTLLHGRPLWKRLPRAAILQSFIRGSTVLYIGSNNREFFIRYGARPGNMFFVPYTADNAAIAARRPTDQLDGRGIRAQLQIGPTDPVVLFVGKLAPKKDPLGLLEAFAAVREPRAHLLIAGSGALDGEVRTAAASDPRVHLLGFMNRSELGALYETSDIFALPSIHHETWGVVVNEAMSHGLAVVTSDAVGSARDLVEPANVFRAGVHQELTRILQRLINDDEMRRAMGERAERRIQEWNVSVAAQGVENAAAQALGDHQINRGADTVESSCHLSIDLTLEQHAQSNT